MTDGMSYKATMKTGTWRMVGRDWSTPYGDPIFKLFDGAIREWNGTEWAVVSRLDENGNPA